MGVLEDPGVRGHVKAMSGLVPVTEAIAREIRVEGFAPDASRAVALTIAPL